MLLHLVRVHRFPDGTSSVSKFNFGTTGLVFVVAYARRAIFPAITELSATKAGLNVLQPILICLIVVMGLGWAVLPATEQKVD